MIEESKFDKQFEMVKRLVRATYNNLEKISNIVEKIEQDERKELYKSLPGVEGTFDGFHLIGEDGSKYEVPSNYAAKSRLVFGDKLKQLDDGDKKVFKQIIKVPRKKIEGILSKKEGKWYLLSDSGSYRISDIAADFNNAELNAEATAFIPEDNLKSPFAALDKVKSKEGEGKEEEEKVEKKEEKPRKIARKKPVVVKKASPKKPPAVPVVKKKTPAPVKKKEVKESKKEYVNNIAGLEDDDLR